MCTLRHLFTPTGPQAARILASSLLAFSEGFLPGARQPPPRRRPASAAEPAARRWCRLRRQPSSQPHRAAGMSGRNLPISRIFRSVLARYCRCARPAAASSPATPCSAAAAVPCGCCAGLLCGAAGLLRCAVRAARWPLEALTISCLSAPKLPSRSATAARPGAPCPRDAVNALAGISTPPCSLSASAAFITKPAGGEAGGPKVGLAPP